MRRYETIIITDPDVKEEARSGLVERIGELIPQHGGFVVELDDWGQRRMAYEVKKKIRGHYTRIDFCGNGSLVDEMERNFRIDDRVIKYMTVLLEKDADVEAIKQAMEAEKSQQQDQSAAAESSADGSDQTEEKESSSPAQPDESTKEEK